MMMLLHAFTSAPFSTAAAAAAAAACPPPAAAGDHHSACPSLCCLLCTQVLLHDARCKPVYDLGSGPYNTARWSPSGRFLAIAGFGNLPGALCWQAFASKNGEMGGTRGIIRGAVFWAVLVDSYDGFCGGYHMVWLKSAWGLELGFWR
jgi:Eukaryotic translation initiation factor eIF2A